MLLFLGYENRNQQPLSNPTPPHREADRKNIAVRLLLLLCDVAQPGARCGLCVLSRCCCTGASACFLKGKSRAGALFFRILRPPSCAAPRLSDRAWSSRVGGPLWGTKGTPGLFSLGAQTYRGSASGCRILPRY